MSEILVGATACAAAVAGLFFLRFWRSTRDRFFLYFALSFFIEGFNRLLIGTQAEAGDGVAGSFFYLLRVLAYGLILLAIWEKNRRPGGSR